TRATSKAHARRWRPIGRGSRRNRAGLSLGLPCGLWLGPSLGLSLGLSGQIGPGFAVPSRDRTLRLASGERPAEEPELVVSPVRDASFVGVELSHQFGEGN